MEDIEDTFWQEYRYGKSLSIRHTGYGDTHVIARTDYDTECDAERRVINMETYSVSGPFALAKANEVFKEWLALELDLSVNK